MKKTSNNENQLPKIYKSKVTTEINKKYYYSKNESINNFTINGPKKNNADNIKDKINNLLKENMIYSNEITLILKNNKIRTRIIRKYDNYILTIDNDKIKYDEIIEILD